MRFLAVFASIPSLVGFRVAELLAVAETLNTAIHVLDGEAQTAWMQVPEVQQSFCVFDAESAACVEAIAQRCMLLRGIFVLLQCGPSLNAILEWRRGKHDHGNVGASVQDHMDARELGVVVGEEEAQFSGDYAYQVETIGKKYSGQKRAEMVDALLVSSPQSLQPQHRQVNFTSPQQRFHVFVQHALQNAQSGDKNFTPQGTLLAVFHCVHLAEGGRYAMLSKYDLRKRPYIGTTSMPPEESVVMANFARVRPGDYVLDPFCGTGSILVAAAHCGAYTLGTDADGRTLRSGTAKGEVSAQMRQQRQLALASYTEEQLSVLTPEDRQLPSMTTNFRLYRLPPPDRLRMNFSTWQSAWSASSKREGGGSAHSEGFLDAILSDPPYGLREPRKKVEEASSAGSTTQAVVSLSPYDTHEVVLDLVLFAAEHLRVGGHLSFWHPTTDHYADDELPTHPSLTIIHNAPQRLSLKVVRRLVTMHKTRPVPEPRPSRESCAPKRGVHDLRQMMDVTVLPDNADYMQYRARVDNKRKATSAFLSTHKEEEAGGGTGAASNSSDASLKQGRTKKVPTQEEIVTNRERKLKLRAEKQQASHEANAEISKRLRGDIK